jgi:hypothetical protein
MPLTLTHINTVARALRVGDTPRALLRVRRAKACDISSFSLALTQELTAPAPRRQLITAIQTRLTNLKS